MGSHVSTEGTPIALEDIALTDDVIRRENLGLLDVPEAVVVASKDIDHNIKVFRLFYVESEKNSGSSATCVPSSRGAGGTASTALMDPFASLRVSTAPHDLTKPSKLRTAEAYLVLHVQRTASGSPGMCGSRHSDGGSSSTACVSTHANDITNPHSPAAVFANGCGGSGRVCADDAAAYGQDVVPAWARHCAEVFTPRGLSAAFSTDVGKPLFFASPRPCHGGLSPRTQFAAGATPEFQFSIHILTGRNVHPLVSAVAVLHALQLERRLTENRELKRFLFFNANFAEPFSPRPPGTSVANGGLAKQRRGHWERRALPHPIGPILLDDVTAAAFQWCRPSLTSTTSTRTAAGASLVGNNGTAACLNEIPDISALHTLTEAYQQNSLLRCLHAVRVASPRMSMPSSARYSHCSTPRGVIPRGLSTLHQKQPTQQGPPPFEIPRLRFSCTPPTAEASDHTSAAAARWPSSVGTTDSPSKPTTKPPPPPGAAKTGRQARLSLPVRRISLPEHHHSTSLPTPCTPQESPLSNLTVTSTANYPHVAAGTSGWLPPGLTNLRLAERLSSNVATPHVGDSLEGLGDHGGAGDKLRRNEEDEQFMSEDRAKRLKLAAPEATQILPWLFVGGELAAKDRAQLLLKGITAVVNTVSFDIRNCHEDVFHYLSLNVCDSPDEPIFSLFPVVNRFVEEEYVRNAGKVLIHCHQGVSRSCSFVIAYIMWREGMCYDRAYESVRAKRNICSPNIGFYVNLLLWERQLSQPVLNKAFAFVPYSTAFELPFSFRLAISFDTQASAEMDGSIADYTTQSSVDIIPADGGTCLLDPRLFYGFVFGSHVRVPSSGHSTEPLSWFCFVGPQCDPTVSSQASRAWADYLTHAFYHGPEERTSTNNKEESIVFTPLRRVVEVQCTTSNMPFMAADGLQVAQQAARLLGQQQSSHPLPILKVVVGEDPHWQPLLQKKELLSKFTADVAEESRIRDTAEDRHCTRMKELRRLHSPHAQLEDDLTLPKTSPQPGVGLSNSRSSQHLSHNSRAVLHSPSSPHQREASPMLRSSATLTTSSTNRSSCPVLSTVEVSPPAVDEPRGCSSSAVTAPTNHAAQLQPLSSNVGIEIYAYPFTSAPIVEPITVEDFEESECLAIVLPTAVISNDENAQHTGNVVYLWVGSGSGVSEHEARRVFLKHRTIGTCGGAYYEGISTEDDDAGLLYSIELYGGRRVANVTVSTVLQGEEPDELLLCL